MFPILADYPVLVAFHAILLLPERNTLEKKGQKGKGEYSQLRLNAEDFNGQLVLAITTWGAVHSYHTHLTNNYFLQKVNFLLRRFLAPRLLSLSTLKTISLTGICSYHCKHFYLPCCHHPSCVRHLSPSESGHPVHLFNAFQLCGGGGVIKIFWSIELNDLWST